MGTDLKIHPAAANGFESQAQAYEKGRPEYPWEAMDYLIHKWGMNDQTQIVDLGAGTGKWTRQWIKTHPSIMAIEPVEGMRKIFSQVLSGVKLLQGSAERIPLEDESVDVVFSAQAFHWFKGEVALREIHRVLKPKGRLALIWNVRDESVDWVSQLMREINVYAKDTPRYATFHWKKAFDQTTLFTPLEKIQFNFVQKSTVEMVVNRIESISFMGALPEAIRRKALDKVRKILAEHPQTKEAEEIGFPYKTDVYDCLKK